MTSALLVNAPSSPVVGAHARPIPVPRTAPAAQLDLEVVIPAFNEARRLPPTLLQAIEFLAAQPWRAGIVVVDNGSADETAEAALRVAADAGSVSLRVLGCTRPGKGAAVRRGLLSSSSRYVGFFDADLATPIETLAVAFSHLRQGATAVIASRHVPGATFVRTQPLRRRAGGALFRMATRSVLRDVRDTQCGFKFFEREAVQRALLQCSATGFAFDVELLRRLQGDGARIVEIPVAWTDDRASTFHPVRDGVAAFADLLQMRRLPLG